MAECAETLQLIRTCLTTGNDSIRRATLKKLLRVPCKEVPASFPLALVGRASAFSDVASLHLCAQLIHGSATEKQSALLKRLVQLTKSFRRSPPSVRIALNQCRLIAPLFAVEALRDVVLTFFVAAVACIEGSVSRERGSQRRAQDRARRAAYRIAKKNILADTDKIVITLLSTAEAFSSNRAEAIAALGVISAIRPEIAAQANDTAKRFLTVVGTIAMKAKPAAADDVVRAVAPSLAHVSSKVANAYLVPALERALVREPEAAVRALRPVLLALKLTDLSEFATKSLTPALLVALKNADEKTRSTGVQLAGTLAFRVKSESALEESVKQLCVLFKSAKYAYQRTAAAQSLQQLLCAKSSPSFGDTVQLSMVSIEQSLQSIVEWLGSKKETNADARSEGCQALLSLMYAAGALEGADVVQNTSCKETADLICKFLTGDKSKEEEKSALLACTSRLQCVPSLSALVDLSTILNHLSALGAGVGRAKQEDAVRALAIIATLAQSDDTFASAVQKSDLWIAIGDKQKSQLALEPTSLNSEIDAKCVLVSCEWLISASHPASELFLSTLLKLATDERHAISRFARECIRRLRKNHGEDMAAHILDVLWKTHFSLAGVAHVPISPYDFNDNGVSAEILGKTLLAVVLPTLPLSCAPKVLLAAHYPRLIRENPISESVKSSRWWALCRKALPQREIQEEDDASGFWLRSCLEEIVGDRGLKSGNDVLVETAVNALGGLGKQFSSGSDFVFRLGLPMLDPLAKAAPQLSIESLDAVRVTQQAKIAAENLAQFKSDLVATKGKKALKKTGNGHLDQRKQAELDKSRAMEAAAKAAIEKAEAVGPIAEQAMLSFQYTSAALRALRSLSISDSARAALRIPAVLMLVLPCAKYSDLHVECRRGLFAIARSGDRLLRGMALELSGTLFGLAEGAMDMNETVASIVGALSRAIPPALDSENFSLVAPVLRAALLRNPDLEDKGISSGGRGSTKRRDAIAVVRSAAQILLEHCKPEAVDAAVAAAAARAGSWAIAVMEREDGAFAAAAESLASLTGTALTPGTEQLSQVLEGVTSGKSSVRDGALSALARIPQLAIANVECPRDSALGRALWLASFDPDESNAELGAELWRNYGHPLHVAEDTPSMLQLVAHDDLDVRTMAACGIANALIGDEKAAVRTAFIPQVFSIYLKSLQARQAEEKEAETSSKKAAVRRDRTTTEIEFDAGWVARHGVALTIEKMATMKALVLSDVAIVFAFLAGRGLGDPHDKVRAKMAAAATAVVDRAGSAGPTVILPMIERHLNTPAQPTSTKQEIAHGDRTRENLVMCLGTLAGFLPADDPRVSKTADQVIRCAVETPSELVQNAAARCLVPLARLSFSQEREKKIRDELIDRIWDAQSSYGERRGACYALAGLCRGLGLKAMKRMRVVEELETAVADKNPRKRLGAFLIIETHAILLGRLFEPFTVASLPHLLMCMGDTVVEVRNACWAAAQAAVSEMSSQGVKMILPSLLSGLQERQWRTRAGAAEVLGAMAFCAPRQLAQCLPQVVPKLAEALADAHTRVVSAAESAINRIAAVVRSPEVRNLSPFLLAALKDPAGRTRGAVDAMLGTEFVHAIDPASLALLIPPLHRGLRDRSTELKKRAAAIVGSMCNNVSNQADVSPYLHLLLPDLRTTLLDAIPDVRKTSARAIGALAVALGEDGLPDIISWLMNALLGTGKPSNVSRDTGYVGAVITSSSAERSGAAMGLAEVSASLSEKRLEEVLGHVMTAGLTNSESREGGLMLIACMPRALGERFESRLALALTAILKGLSDDSDNVREAALEAGRNLVQAYAKSSLERLLPELMSAMKDKLWRIRQAAARLLGDFLLVIAGARPSRSDAFGAIEPVAVEDEGEKEDGDEDGEGEGGENGTSEHEDEEQYESPEAAAAAMTTEATMKAIEEVLGWDRRNEVLAALFIIRCDVSVRVRQMGMQVWKTVVSNTPRVLREIMPTAVRQVVDGLGDEDPERRAAAGKALGDLSLKLGDRVVPEVLPALRFGIRDEDSSARVRRGACEGLVELVEACPRHQLVEHASDLVAVVYEALCDSMAEVRATAAGVFSSLLTPLGAVAVDAVVPLLIEKISGAGASDTPSTGEDADRALDALKQILRASGNRLMSIVVPRLTEEVPLALTSARALAAAAQVAEGAFDEHVTMATEAIIGTLESPVSLELEKALEDISHAVVVASENSSRTLMDVVCRAFNEGSPWRRAASSRICGCICRGTPADDTAKLAGSLYEVLIRQLGDPDDDTVLASWQALLDLSMNVHVSELSTHIPTIRQSLRSVAAGDASTSVPGLQLPKAPAPFVPVLCEGLLRGAPELREQSALGLAELVEMTNVTSLKPFVVKMVGPLIRVMSERFPWQVKAAILRAMTVILEKCAPMLRAFAPQLQSTFLKCLSDGSRLVRVRACAALGCLVPIQMRLEPLLNDLVTLGANGSTTESRAAAFHGCSQVYKHGKKLPESAFSRFAHSISEGVLDEESEVATAAGRALGQVASRSRSAEEYAGTLELAKNQLEQQSVEYSVRVHALDAAASVFVGGEKLEGLEFEHIASTVELIEVLMTSVTPPVQGAACMAGARAVALLAQASGLAQTNAASEHRRSLVGHISGRAEFDDSAQVRVAALQALAVVVSVDKTSMGICAPALVVCAAATNTAIKGASERVMRKAFVDPKDLSVRNAVVEIAKDALSEDDQLFIDRRIPRLRVASESDDESGS